MNAFKKGELSTTIKVEEVILENERNRSHALQQLLLLCTPSVAVRESNKHCCINRCCSRQNTIII